MHPYHTENEADLPAVKRSNLQISVREMESEIDRQIGMLDDWRKCHSAKNKYQLPEEKGPEFSEWVQRIWSLWADAWDLMEMENEKEAQRCRQLAATDVLPREAKEMVRLLGDEFNGAWKRALIEKTKQKKW